MMLYELDEIELAVLTATGSPLLDEATAAEREANEGVGEDWIDELLKEGCPF